MEEMPSGYQSWNKNALYKRISEAMQQENTMLHDSIDKLVANPCSVGLAQTSPVVPLGLVIGTYAALPYIHLQLEARRRLYPDEQPVEYGRLAQEWGLPYSEEDFVDPNMGTGPGKAPPFCVNTT